MTRLHNDELDVDVDLVRGFVDRSRPAWARLPVTRLASSGSSNALFRLGDDLLVRVPRQPGGSESIEKEAHWLPVVAPAIPVPVPEVVHVGDPGLGYPERWSVVRWVPGRTPAVPGPPGPGGQRLAADLAAVVAGLCRAPVPDRALRDGSLRWYRGEPLASMDASTRAQLEACRSLPGLDLDLDLALEVWTGAIRAPDVGELRTPRWYHGDLLAENLLVDGDRLCGVLDFGGLAVGDPSVDLVVAWELLDAPARAAFRDAVDVDVDEATWRRGRAWALAIALMTFPYYWATMPKRCADRLVMARAVLADAS